MEYYTKTEIWHLNNDKCITGNDSFKGLVCRAMINLEIDIVDEILDNCLIVMPQTEEGGCYFPKESIKTRDLILFPENILKVDEKEAIYTILHGLAHHRLKHKDPSVHYLDKVTIAQQEEEANTLVDKWLKARSK